MSDRGRSCLYLDTAQETVMSQMLLSGSVQLHPTATETQLYCRCNFGKAPTKVSKIILHLVSYPNNVINCAQRNAPSHNLNIVQSSDALCESVSNMFPFLCGSVWGRRQGRCQSKCPQFGGAGWSLKLKLSNVLLWKGQWQNVFYPPKKINVSLTVCYIESIFTALS